MSIVDAAQVLQSLHIPGQVITDNLSAGGVFVGSDNILRVIVTADTYVAFGPQSIGAVSSATSPGLLLQAGEHYIICADDYVRTSLNPSRVELLGL